MSPKHKLIQPSPKKLMTAAFTHLAPALPQKDIQEQQDKGA